MLSKSVNGTRGKISMEERMWDCGRDWNCSEQFQLSISNASAHFSTNCNWYIFCIIQKIQILSPTLVVG